MSNPLLVHWRSHDVTTEIIARSRVSSSGWQYISKTRATLHLNIRSGLMVTTTLTLKFQEKATPATSKEEHVWHCHDASGGPWSFSKEDFVEELSLASLCSFCSDYWPTCLRTCKQEVTDRERSIDRNSIEEYVNLLHQYTASHIHLVSTQYTVVY